MEGINALFGKELNYEDWCMADNYNKEKVCRHTERIKKDEDEQNKSKEELQPLLFIEFMSMS